LLMFFGFILTIIAMILLSKKEDAHNWEVYFKCKYLNTTYLIKKANL
jgi:hypothetical protein